MQTEILVRGLADTLWYLETADNGAISPEAASVVYDIVADTMLRLDKAEKAEVAAVLAGLARSVGDAEQAEFLADLPNGLGLIGSDE
jgi:hypothetical protein